MTSERHQQSSNTGSSGNSRSDARRPRLLLAGPYFRPTCYGGVVQVYDQLLRRLSSVDRVIVSQRLGGDPLKMDQFDRTAHLKHGYDVRRMERYELIFPPETSWWKKAFDTGRFVLQTRSEWRRIVRAVRPDLIVCGATLYAGWLMDQIPGSIPFINYLHGEELAGSSKSRFFWRYLFRKQLAAIRRADLNISVSRYTAHKAAALAGIDVRRIALLPNFVDTGRFSPPLHREALRRRLGWQEKKVILTLSRLARRKGIDQAIRALAQLRHQGKLPAGWMHVIAGGGEQECELRALAASVGADGYTRFEGYIEEHQVPDFYGAADIFLLPNRDLSGDTEGFGIVFLEASACGTAVIGGVAGGTADAIREGVTGFRVDGEDISAIARAVLQLVNDEGLRRLMGLAGVETIRREHRIETAVARFEELVFQVVRSGRRPRLRTTPPIERAGRLVHSGDDL